MSTKDWAVMIIKAEFGWFSLKLTLRNSKLHTNKNNVNTVQPYLTKCLLSAVAFVKSFFYFYPL